MTTSRHLFGHTKPRRCRKAPRLITTAPPTTTTTTTTASPWFFPNLFSAGSDSPPSDRSPNFARCRYSSIFFKAFTMKVLLIKSELSDWYHLEIIFALQSSSQGSELLLEQLEPGRGPSLWQSHGTWYHLILLLNQFPLQTLSNHCLTWEKRLLRNNSFVGFTSKPVLTSLSQLGR